DALGVCGGSCAADTDGDGVCDTDEISGCTDEEASNYNGEATDDDGSCEYDETCEPSWGEPTVYPNLATVLARITRDGENAGADDKVGAYIGNELRGEGEIIDFESATYINMVIYLDGIDESTAVTFVYFDADEDACETCPIDGSLEVEISGEYGSFETPVLIDSRCEDLVLDVPLQAGWNYVSTPLQAADMSVAAVFEAGLGDNLLKVLGDDDFALSGNYTPGIPDVFNTLTATTDGGGYVVKVESDAVWTSTGAPVDPEATSLGLNAGWNIVGYVPQETLALDDALASIDGVLERVIDGQNGLIYHVDNPAPLNTLETLEPGRSYWVKISAGADLVYPGTLSGITDEIAGGDISENSAPTLRTDACAAAQSATGWNVERLPYVAQLVGRVMLNEQPVVGEAYIGAFEGDLCRSAMPLSQWNGESFGAMAVHTEGGVALEFKLWLDGVLFTSIDSWVVEPGASYGDATTGFPNIRFESNVGVTSNQNIELAVAIFPSPADDFTTITWNSNQAMALQLVDATGRIIEQTQASVGAWRIDVGNLTDGMYFVHLNGVDGKVSRGLVIKH
ncbi:MAG: T9SS type A sorting domain-containing protein, partial [Flavobacteriales bacterium]|nr:T9SS type A sorting domain-containing protein [Flavobacteriales bacterium]